MKLNWNFLGGWGVQNKKPSVGGVWIFSGTAHLHACKQCYCSLDMYHHFTQNLAKSTGVVVVSVG